MPSHDLSPFGAATQKYWDRRRSYFSKWDDGIETDAEGLFSVKPENFAREIAQKLKGDVIFDAFCGIGGSAIAFALAGKRVIATDISQDRLKMAIHNAKIYGVSDRIDFMHGDALAFYDPLFDTLRFDALHIDPPWGGPDYFLKHTFGWRDFRPDPFPLVRKAMDHNINIAVGLPINFDASELATFSNSYTVEEAREGERHLFDTLYFPART